jgi:opacity protein-like surface antigen
MLSHILSHPRHFLCAAWSAVIAVTASDMLTAGEIELKSLNTVQNDPAAKSKYGPYVSVFGGANNSQTGNVNIGGFDYSLNDRDNSAVFGFEVGKTWRTKKAPIAFSMDFEGSFMQTELSGALDPEVAARPRSAAAPPVSVNPLIAELQKPAPGTPRTPASPSDSTVAGYTADMNAAFFMVNGTVSLDLWRYRARLGKFIAGLRPYIGGGFGGGQIWFRNSYSISLAQADDPTSTVLPSATPFVIDEFVTAWQWYGGIEYAWQDKYSVFAEFRQFHLGELEDMTDFQTKGYTVGFRYRY